MACNGRNSCNNCDSYECDINMNVVSGVTDNAQTNGCCGCCCCCGCGNCGAVGGTSCNRNCGPDYYVTNTACDCAEETEDTDCGCGACNNNTCGTCNTCSICD